MPRRLAVTVIALAVAGCADDTPASHVVVRDSAGIELVEHGEDGLAAAAAWTIEPEPLLDLGVVDGDPAYQFYRVADGVRLDDGRIVVTDGGSAEVRIYAADGTHLRSLGGRGEGPGEFGFPYGVWRMAADSIAVFDMGLQRISVWAAAGEHGRVARLAPTFVNEPELVGVLPAGELLFFNMVLAIPETGFDTIWADVHRYGADGVSLDTVGRYPFGVMGKYGLADMVGGPAFQPRTVVAAVGATIVVGRASSHELLVLDAAAQPRRVIRWTGPDLAVTAAALDAYRAERLARATDDNARRRVENILASQPESKSFPAYDEFVADRSDNVWVREFRPPDSDGPSRYTVFGPDGRISARVELPAEFRVLEIGEDYVLATTADELDVEHVVLHRLRREPVE